MRVLVTGGAGFIGSALVRRLITDGTHEVLNLDKLTYAGNLLALDAVSDNARYRFVQGDIADCALVASLLQEFRPEALVHLAAESHVDRSIAGPAAFIQTNIVGTYTLLECALEYWRGLSGGAQESFRFLHVSTDEVFGSLSQEGQFNEGSPYNPSSPYSASKAASDHLARAWHRTYGLPVMISHSTNNYGPWQHPEKLIPLVISRALCGEAVPVYGDGMQVRDWLHVDDHVAALRCILARGTPGETYAVGANCERRNLDLVQTTLTLLDGIVPRAGASYADLITHISDRPGHDFRYAIDPAKIGAELGWQPAVSFESGLAETVQWLVDHRDWLEQTTTR